MVNVELIEQLRKSHGYTQKQMGVAIGCKSKTAYQNKINGSVRWNISDISAICRLFSLEPNDLILI